jgi:CRP-like cAMP-binding protein
MSQIPHLSFAVTKVIGERLIKLERKLESMVFKDVRTRLVDFLKDSAIDHGKKIGHEVLIQHNLTHQDMANLIATSRQTVTTILNDLKEQDMIYMERNKILIRDLSKLK